MGYLVVFSIDGTKSAHYFDEYNDAVDFINTSCDKSKSAIRELHGTGKEDEYRAILTSGQKLMIRIVPKERKNVKYDLMYIENSNKPITKDFLVEITLYLMHISYLRILMPMLTQEKMSGVNGF